MRYNPFEKSWYISLSPAHGLPRMDNLNGRLNGLPKWTTLNYLPCKKKTVTKASLFLINNSKDSINERFGRQLKRGRSQKLTHMTEMQMIINIQIFTCVNLLRKAKFLLAPEGICRLPSHGTNECARRTADQQHIKKQQNKMAKVALHLSKQPSFGYLFFFKVGNIG